MTDSNDAGYPAVRHCRVLQSARESRIDAVAPTAFKSLTHPSLSCFLSRKLAFFFLPSFFRPSSRTDPCSKLHIRSLYSFLPWPLGLLSPTPPLLFVFTHKCQRK